MVDLHALQLALRARLAGVVLPSTGTITLSATASGYVRQSGSFVADGFVVGLPITPVGFATNAPSVITGVTATTVTVAEARPPQPAGSGRRLDVTLPGVIAWDNLAATPTGARAMLTEELVPATTTLRSASADGGRVESTGLYVLRVTLPSDIGHRAHRTITRAVMARYAPGLRLVLPGGTCHIRADVAPFEGPIRPREGGVADVLCTIPWRAFAVNALAA